MRVGLEDEDEDDEVDDERDQEDEEERSHGVVDYAHSPNRLQ
jgi:hypothetical protein